MKMKKRKHIFGIGALGLFLLVYIVLFHVNYPSVGHDYSVYFTLISEGMWYFFHGGIRVARYSVHHCGGSILYGNPLDMYYSLPQFLSFVVDPWSAIQISTMIALILGYWGWYLVGERVLHLAVEWSHLLALVIVANGYYFIHLLAGHYTYHGLPLIGLLVYCLLDPGHRSIKKEFLYAIMFAVLATLLLYAGNWMVLFLFILGFPFVIFPLLILGGGRMHQLWQLLIRTFLFGSVSILLCASKLIAIGSYLRAYPRLVGMERIDSGVSVLGYIIKAFWLIPQRSSAFVGVPAELHEKSSVLSPIVLIGLILSLLLLKKNYRSFRGNWMWVISSFLFGIFFIISMIQFVGGRGILIESLDTLPIFSSQRIITRYIYIFSLLVSVVGIWCLARLVRLYVPRISLFVVSAGSVVTIIGLAGAYYPVLTEVRLSTDLGESRLAIKSIDYAQSVTTVESSTNYMERTVQPCYDPIITSANNPQNILHIGPTDDIENGYFNLMNPACYQYPEENNCKPGDRISVRDRENFENFRRGLPVSWRVSMPQFIADRLTLLSVCAVVFVGIFFLIRSLQRFKFIGLTYDGTLSMRRATVFSIIIFLLCVLTIVIVQLTWFPGSLL